MGAFGIGPTRHVFVSYDFAGGLDRGSPVRLAGIKVGRVVDIAFKGGSSEVLRLKVDVNREAFAQITDDSKFFVNLAGLIGERYVEVVPGQGAHVENGHEFRGIDPPRIDQLISQGYGIFGDLRALFNENKGDIKEILTSLNELSKNLSQLTKNGTASQRRQLSQLLENFAAMSTDLRATMATLNAGATHIRNNGGEEAWRRLNGVLVKADNIGLQDIRRLMLEDGVKVNFSSKKVEVPARDPR
jgi:phospholipid/cholesterol/gamma-HCH transport system substrate-binding protein